MFKFKENILFYVVVGFIILICLRVYYESENYNLKCIISSVDGNKYCVRDRALLESAADLLAEVTQKMKELVKYMNEKYPEDPVIKIFIKRCLVFSVNPPTNWDGVWVMTEK